MGIQVEYNPDLALRDFSLARLGERTPEECIPEILERGKVYGFLKKGQRNYWLHGEIPLIETKGGGILSKPKASIIILETTHFLQGGEAYTKGKYEVVQVFSDSKVHFEGFKRI